MWRFEAVGETTASNTIYEIVGFDGKLYMEFPDVLEAVELVEVSPSTGLVISGVAVSDDEAIAEMDAVAGTLEVGGETGVGEYTLVLMGTTVDGAELFLRGKLVIESLLGT